MAGNDVIERIESKIDLAKAGSVAISNEVGGIQFQTMMEVMEFAKMMSVSDVAVPPHLRGKPGACLAVCIQALEWRMSPFSVANKSYSVVNKGVERIAYEAQLIHAIIEARAPIVGRLRHAILGEGNDRRCKVWATFKGESEPHVYLSETLGKLIAARGRNEYGKVKGSPLWDDNPEVQMAYHSVRLWGRLYCPDVILGIYSKDELEDEGAQEIKDVTPKGVPGLADRLKAGSKGKRGFDAAHVEHEVASAKGEPSTTLEASAEPARAEVSNAPPDTATTDQNAEADTGAGDEAEPDPVADAFAAGAAAKRAGKTKRAMPAALREPSREDEHTAWLRGFEEAETASKGAAAEPQASVTPSTDTTTN
ncbi:recombinase RecT [Rhodopseudomonas palustris]|nr:recombinase RecT [Rhodopseudomonas palustris]